MIQTIFLRKIFKKSYSDRKKVTKINPFITILRRLVENVFYRNERVNQVRERYRIQETRDLIHKRKEGSSQNEGTSHF